VERLASLIDPAKVIAGGKSDPDAHYLDPTLLYPIAWEDKSMKDEILLRHGTNYEPERMAA
jgi:aldehyde dehydrogenase (NAD+)